MKKRARRGFTLPEVLVTVTVVAVLAAVVVPAVTQYVSKGDAPASEQDFNQIRNAITSYVADTRHYPANIYALTADDGSTGWKGPYLQASVSGNTAVGTGNGGFVSNGVGITLGQNSNGAISSTTVTGYLTVDLTITGKASPTCQDLYNLDKQIDQGSGTTSTATASADATTGALTWTNTSCTTASDPAPTATFKLVSVGK